MNDDRIEFGDNNEPDEEMNHDTSDDEESISGQERSRGVLHSESNSIVKNIDFSKPASDDEEDLFHASRKKNKKNKHNKRKLPTFDSDSIVNPVKKRDEGKRSSKPNTMLGPVQKGKYSR